MKSIIAIILWVILFAISWPIALLLLFVLPVLWLLLLPFRLLGFTLQVVFEILHTIIMLPFRIIKAI